MGPSDVVYMVKRRDPRTDPQGNPVDSWCSLDTSPSQENIKDLLWANIQTSGVKILWFR